jgi:hypothetical protein
MPWVGWWCDHLGYRIISSEDRIREKYLKNNTMSHQLTLHIPDSLYSPLTQVASKTGQTPEQLVLQYLSQAIQSQTDDPVEQYIGAFSSTTPDWADQHDTYLGESHLNPPQN